MSDEARFRQEIREELLAEMQADESRATEASTLPMRREAPISDTKFKSAEMRVTSFEELEEVAKGTIVELPAFASGKPFYARLKRPSMLALVKSKKIPNELLNQANDLFAKGSSGMDSADIEMMANIFKIMDTICEASFSEPTYKELMEKGIELTDEQLMFVFNYSQRGVKALGDFR